MLESITERKEGRSRAHKQGDLRQPQALYHLAFEKSGLGFLAAGFGGRRSARLVSKTFLPSNEESESLTHRGVETFAHRASNEEEGTD
jgi:hypothetical protein